MPCNGPGGYENYEYEDLEKRLNYLEAALCLVLSNIPKNITTEEYLKLLADDEFKEAGITRKSLLKWWKEHQEKDRKRKEKEKRQLLEATVKKRALNKLTETEKKALGLK